MANKKISQLTALGGNFTATDLFEISQDTGGGTYASKKITGAELSASISTSIAIGDTITSGTQGSVLFLGAAGVLAQDNANFFWDDSNNRLGIGTASPSFALHVLNASSDLDTKFESNGGHSRFIIDSTGTDDSILQFNEANARRWSIYTDGTDDSFKITRSDVPTASPTSDAIAIDSTDNVSIPNGTLTINNYTFPAADGAANQIIQTDGAGNLSFVAAGGGGASVLNDLTDVSILGSGVNWSFFKNGITPDGAPVTGTFSGNRNVALSPYALYSITSGEDNISMGYQSMFSLTSGDDNIAFGDSALRTNSTGSFNIAIGRRALFPVTGTGNIGIGQQAGTTISTGTYNTILGYQTDFGSNEITTGSYNISIGMFVGTEDGTADGRFTLGTGHVSPRYLMAGDFATAGQAKLGINLGGTGSGNKQSPNQPTATLEVKGQGTTSATTSLLIKDSAGSSLIRLNDDGQGIAIGHDAGGAGGANIGGNICIGKAAMEANGSGQDNVYIGTSSGFVGNAGWRNVALGASALRGKSGNYTFYSTAIGYYSMYDSTSTGAYTGANTALGAVAGKAITSGVNNLCLGTGAGYNLTTGSNNIFIGPATGGINSSIVPTGYVAASSASVSNELNIGGQLIGSMDSSDRYTKFTGQVYTPTSTLTDGATITPDFTNGNVFTVTLAGNRTLANPTNPKDGATYCIIVKQDATGSRTLAYGTNYKWEGGTAPTLSTGANAVDILTFVSDGTNMYGTIAQNFS